MAINADFNRRIINLECSKETGGDAVESHFEFFVIDDTRYLADSYALRYDIYCEELGFLSTKDYPERFEKDVFDESAIHIGAVNKAGVLVGTARLVLPSSHGLPLFKHCKLFDKCADYVNPANPLLSTAAEVSRLALIKSCRRRAGDGLYDLAISEDDEIQTKANANVPHRRHRSEIVLGIYKILYQESKRRGITHWFAAMEKTLLRLLYRYKFAFNPIGEEVDYYGPVTPYLAELAVIEEGVRRQCPALYAEYIKGLKPELVADLKQNNTQSIHNSYA